jgi:hypothetical protein
VSKEKSNDPTASEEAHLGIRLDLEPAITQVTFTAERIYGRRVIRPNFLLFGIVTDAHPDVIITSAAWDEHLESNIPLVWWSTSTAYHHILKGNSNRVIRIPWPILRALSPRACMPGVGQSEHGTDELTRTWTCLYKH